MNEDEIDAQWKLEKAKRYQHLLDYLKPAQQGQPPQAKQTEQRLKPRGQEHKDAEHPSTAAERAIRRRSR